MRILRFIYGVGVALTTAGAILGVEGYFYSSLIYGVIGGVLLGFGSHGWD